MYPYTLTLIASRVELRLPHVTLTGALAYDPAFSALVLIHDDGEHHVLSTVLLTYGYLPFFGETFIKDWTEHSGLTDALVMAGVVSVVERLTVARAELDDDDAIRHFCFLRLGLGRYRPRPRNANYQASTQPRFLFSYFGAGAWRSGCRA